MLTSTLTLALASISVVIGGFIVEKKAYGAGTALVGVGLILGMMYAAQTVVEAMIALH